MIEIEKGQVSMGWNYSISKNKEFICITTLEKNAEIIANAFKEDNEEIIKTEFNWHKI
jgi:hypothetical protein